MGSRRSHRQRLFRELNSVRVKGLFGYLSHRLTREYSLSRMAARELADRSLELLSDVEVQLPGQVWVSVPSSASKKLVFKKRHQVLITAIDVQGDTGAWEQYGLAGLQRRRLLRWMYEIYRQGGHASLKELAAWSNLTPNSVGNRLRWLRETGIWIPYLGGSTRCESKFGVEEWLLDRYFSVNGCQLELDKFGLVPCDFEKLLSRFARVLSQAKTGQTSEEIASGVFRSVDEVKQWLEIAQRYTGTDRLKDAEEAHGPINSRYSTMICVAQEVEKEFGFPPVLARVYAGELKNLGEQLGQVPLGEGKMSFFAIDAQEGARAQLNEAALLPVLLSWFSGSDLEVGPRSSSPTCVAELKFGKVLRYTTEARKQGALLTLPDLAVLMGISVSAIRKQIAAQETQVVPTRGWVKDMGRGVSHKTHIVELYLQMHTESEIVDRTGHGYESVEAYLGEFARVVSLADRGMNAVMIRRVLGRSLALVESYLALYRRYEKPEYHFRLAYLRGAFAREETDDETKKKVVRFSARSMRR